MKLTLDTYTQLHQNNPGGALNRAADPKEPNEELDILLNAVKELESAQILPSELLHYSKRTDGTIEYTKNGLRVLKNPTTAPKTTSRRKCLKKSLGIRSQRSYIGADLAAGYSSHVPPLASQLFLLEDLFACIERAKKKDASLLQRTTIVTLRRNILQLMLLPLTKQECRFNVVSVNGIIVLDFDWHFDATLGKELPRDHSRLAYTGRKFEEVVTTPPEGYEAFYGIFQHHIGNVSVLLSAEIDATTGQNEYAELKTHTHHKGAPMSPSLAQKLAKTWSQNVLVGTKHAVFGFRAHSSHTYRLRAVKGYTTDEIRSSMPETTTALLRWYRCVVLWLSQEAAPKGPIPAVRKVEFAAGQLEMSEIGGPESALIAQRLVPCWCRQT